MPSADVVVVGAGLAGLLTALQVAETGASVEVLAHGHAATHWVGGPIDVAAVPGTPTARAGVELLAARTGHPYAVLGDVDAAIRSFLDAASRTGLAHIGSIDAPFAALPTSL